MAAVGVTGNDPILRFLVNVVWGDLAGTADRLGNRGTSIHFPEGVPFTTQTDFVTPRVASDGLRSQCASDGVCKHTKFRGFT